jgi:hypothetical protein
MYLLCGAKASKHDFIGAAKMSCASARMFSIQPDCCSFHHDKMKTAGSRFVPGNRGIKQALPNE